MYLAALPKIDYCHIGFRLASPRPDRIHPPPATRTVLLALTHFEFRGASEYLEDLVSRIGAPQLNGIYISCLNQLVDFRVAQLPMFINHAGGPKLNPFRYARVTFYSDPVTFRTYLHATDSPPDPCYIITYVLCEWIDWQFSHIARVISNFSATLSNVVHLKLEVHLAEDRQLEGTVDIERLCLLHQFPTVQTLHVSHELEGHVALALEDIDSEGVAQALPSLDLIYLSDQQTSSIEKFITAREPSGRSVTVVETPTEFEKKNIRVLRHQ